MSQTTIAAQMYTIRDHTQTPSDIAKSCRRLSEMGYGAVQTSALGEIETDELARILEDEGLVCAATHVDMDMLKDTNRCAEYHEALGCKFPAIGGFNPEKHTVAAYEQFAREFGEAGGALAQRGLRVGYHNHSRELAHPEDSDKRILDIIIDNTPESIWFEIDVYWIQHGGGDPAAWIDKVAGRIPCIHFKDMDVTTSQEQKMCEIGSGNLNWPRIIDSCRNAGTQWYLVERDSGDLDPFDSLEISLKNMQAMGLQ